MSELRETKKKKLIAFCVTDEEYAKIESIALGEDLNNWCRNITVPAALEGSGLTKTERLIYEEIVRIRFPQGNAARHLFVDQSVILNESEAFVG